MPRLHELPEGEGRESGASHLQERLEALHCEHAALTSALSHDLQEPLRMVVGFMDLLQEEYAPALDATGREYVAFAADGARRMQRMLEGLLRLSRVSSEVIAPRAVHPLDAWRMAQARLGSEIRERGARVSAGRLPRVQFDSGQLELALTCLLDNALAFVGSGPPVVRLVARQDARGLTLCVEDEGIGVPLDQQERAFRPFATMHPQHPARGVGVGLSLVRRIVHRHGGRIWLESNGQSGGLRVCFTVRAAGGSSP